MGAAVTFSEPAHRRLAQQRLEAQPPRRSGRRRRPPTTRRLRERPHRGPRGRRRRRQRRVVQRAELLHDARRRGRECIPFRDRTGDGVTVDTGSDQRGAWDAGRPRAAAGEDRRGDQRAGRAVVGLLEIENSAALGESADEALGDPRRRPQRRMPAPARWAFVPSPADLPDRRRSGRHHQRDHLPAGARRRRSARRARSATRATTARRSRTPASRSRQAFAPVGGGEDFLVVVNHFKSKGSAGPWPGDADTGDGQGASNESRVRQATALRDWVATDLTGAGTDSVAARGRLQRLRPGGPAADPVRRGLRRRRAPSTSTSSSYSFSGLSGSLDHVLSTPQRRSAPRAPTSGHQLPRVDRPGVQPLQLSRHAVLRRTRSARATTTL